MGADHHEVTRTRSTYVARHERDKLERADDAFWRALRQGMNGATAREQYDTQLELAMMHALEWQKLQTTNYKDMTQVERSGMFDQALIA